jgi:hypothetical protein
MAFGTRTKRGYALTLDWSSRPFNFTVVQLAQLVLGIVEFVIGFVLVAIYGVAAGGQSASISGSLLAVLLPAAILAFVFGILSFAAALLALGTRPSVGPIYAEQNYTMPMTTQTAIEQAPTPQPTAEVSRTEVGRTVVQRTSSWSELVCGNCGREVERNAKFCDNCGSRLAPSEKPAPEIRH